ncbi:MAG: hypothetical protein RDV41_12775, partial [Planctomycetota bacterium]|nr:hypothetical protein [Planctomycetota bacterium]
MVGRKVMVALCCVALAGALFAGNSNEILNVQGKLTDSSGNALTGSYDMTFSIYLVSGGGVPQFTEAWTGANQVPVTNGIYNVNVGYLTGGGIPLTVFANADLWLEIGVGAETLAPRSHLTAHAFAFSARTLDGIASGNASGEIPISNGVICMNLNAELLAGQNDAYYLNATSINAGLLDPAYGGTGLDTSGTAGGEILYSSAPGVWAELTPGAANDVLTISGGVPIWQSLPAPDGGITSLGGQTGVTQTFANDTNVTMTSNANTHSLGWLGQLAVSRGGTGAATLTGMVVGNGAGAFTTATSSPNYIAYWLDANTISGEQYLDVTRGGTGGTGLTGILKGNGVLPFSAITGSPNYVAYWLDANTISGEQYLDVARGGTGTGSALTQGSVVFSGAGGIYSHDNANLFWDDTNNYLGIRTTTPGQALTVDGTFGILEGGGTPTFHTIFQGGDQIADVAYTLPIDDGTNGQVLATDGSGVLSWTSSPAGSAPIDRPYVTIGSDGFLTAERALTASNGITITDMSANNPVYIALGNLTNNWDQQGAFDILLTNAGSELRTLENVGGIYYGTFDVGDLTSDQTYTFPDCPGTVVLGTSTSNYAAYWTTGNSLAGEQYLDVTRGGTGAAGLTGIVKGNGAGPFSAITGSPNYVAYWLDANTIGGEQYLDVTRGGTGGTGLTGMLKGNGAGAFSAVTGSPNYVAYWLDANTIAAEQYLDVSRGGTGTSSAFTPGSVLFAGPTGAYAQDNVNFFWDNTNKRLGIGNDSPENTLEAALFDPSTNTVLTVASIERESTGGTPAAGIGAALTFSVEDSSEATVEDTARISAILTVPTDGSEKGVLAFGTCNNPGGIAERMRLQAD